MVLDAPFIPKITNQVVTDFINSFWSIFKPFSYKSEISNLFKIWADTVRKPRFAWNSLFQARNYDGWLFNSVFSHLQTDVLNIEQPIWIERLVLLHTSTRRSQKTSKRVITLMINPNQNDHANAFFNWKECIAITITYLELNRIIRVGAGTICLRNFLPAH